MVDWGGALASWINRWNPASHNEDVTAAVLRDAVLAPVEPSEPPHTFLDVAVRGTHPADATLLMAEAWWADTVLAPTYRDLVRWSLVIVPWTIASHFLTRLRSSERRHVIWLIWDLVTMLAALMAMPLVLLAVMAVLLLGVIPVPQIRAVAGALQRALAETIGDSLVLLNNDVQRAAIVARVRGNIRWLAERCENTIVVAHSQGAAIAYEALRTSGVDGVTLVTFGSGLAKLLEAEWLFKTSRRKLWAPWLFSAGGVLVAIGLWASLPALVRLGQPLLVAVGICVALSLILRVFESKLSKSGVVALSLLAASPIGVIVWKWLDESPWALLLLAAQYAIVIGAQLAISERPPTPLPPPNVSTWLDVHASQDPVSNVGLFESPGSSDVYSWIRQIHTQRKSKPLKNRAARVASVKVWNRRSSVSDHTSYWASDDDFTAKIAWLIGHVAGFWAEAIPSDDTARLRHAARRRRWRTGWLAAARTVALAAPLLIVGAQGLTTDLNALEPVAGRPLAWAQSVSTARAAELIAIMTPESMKPWIANPPSSFATSPAVVGLASLAVMLLLVVAGLLLIVWRWSVWDRTEIARVFEKKDLCVLEPQFIVFLLVSAAVFELIAFAALGWLADLRGASRESLMRIGNQLGFFMFAGAYFWVLRTVFFFIGNFDLGKVRRGAGAAAVSCLTIAPLLAWDASNSALGSISQAEDLGFLGRHPYLGLLVILPIWLVPVSRMWRPIEPILVRRMYAGPPLPVPLSKDVPTIEVV